jgi:hypothetical protein
LYKETGNSFFETNDWTRESVRGFYDEDVFSQVTPQDRQDWLRSRFEPFWRKKHRLTILKLNPVQMWPQFFYEAILRRLKKRMAQFS